LLTRVGRNPPGTYMIRAGGRWAHQFHGVGDAVSQARLRLARPAADLDVQTDLYEQRNPLDPGWSGRTIRTFRRGAKSPSWWATLRKRAMCSSNASSCRRFQ